YWKNFPHTTVRTDGEFVGLPPGQMGNSEVGHQNLGAGRVVLQLSMRITKAIKDGSFFKNPAFARAFDNVFEQRSRLHLIGLVSDGGVHSLLDHLLALLDLTKRERLPEVYIHAFLDGRDTPPTSGASYIRHVREYAEKLGVGKIATIVGRYYAMDRDNRWERIEKAFRLVRFGEGRTEKGKPEEIVARAYERSETDEFVQPITLDPSGAIRDKDSVIFFNFRPDRARQITRTFIDKEFSAFDRGGTPRVTFVGMTPYEDDFLIPAAFASEEALPNIMSKVLTDHHLTQLRIAETEKYAHVTYFFNNGRETPFVGEDRKLIPSPKVPTYDLKPEMSAYELTREAVGRITSGQYDFVLLNYANPDMVGHTGVYEAAIKACEAVDVCLGKLVEATLAQQGELLLTADHGNADLMRDENGQPHTAHTTSPGPLIYVGPRSLQLANDGALCDVSPTMLALMGLPQPREMTGKNLLK
ncbi:2,3-bisphosphoglycerate-independent phosphoglycerate mutase, partial [Candidatus Acetothermia bacterium]|nr:2,3-bisphosphoglycerate-independent phosphoglycerate mutase [Candidatus Acetothermia bacterium]